MTWAAALGIGMGEITYRPGGSYGVSALDLNMIRDSISAALETPWMVTPLTTTLRRSWSPLS